MIGKTQTQQTIRVTNALQYRDADGVHDAIGTVTTTFREFTFGAFDFALINKAKFGR